MLVGLNAVQRGFMSKSSLAEGQFEIRNLKSQKWVTIAAQLL
jgi:hypothetical protein